MRCEEVREMLPAYADERQAELSVRRHLSRCADCRAEAERYRALVSGLGGLATVTAEAPAGLAASLGAIPARRSTIDEARTHLLRNRRRYLGGLAGAAAVAGTAALLRSRARRVAAA